MSATVAPPGRRRAAADLGRRLPGVGAPAWLAPAACAVVLAIDAALGAVEPGFGPALGAVDDTAHLLTTAVLLCALPGRRTVAFAAAALVASVLIDLDHIPQLLDAGAVNEDTGRPVSHSLPSVLVALAAALGARRRSAVVRSAALGAAFGLAAHFFRDLASGPGVALLWPLSDAGARVPWAVYGTLLVAATVVARHRTHG